MRCRSVSQGSPKDQNLNKDSRARRIEFICKSALILMLQHVSSTRPSISGSSGHLPVHGLDAGRHFVGRKGEPRAVLRHDIRRRGGVIGWKALGHRQVLKFLERFFRLTRPEWHLETSIQTRGLDEMLAGLLALVRSAVSRAKAEMTMGHQRNHPEL
jgi:hypothetical protein